MTNTTLPDKETRCHRTGFEKTCFECVTQYNCRLWRHLVVDADRATGEVLRDMWGCVDSLQQDYALNLMGRQDTTTATVDKLSRQVAESHDASMVGAIARLNHGLVEHDARRHANGALIDDDQRLLPGLS